MHQHTNQQGRRNLEDNAWTKLSSSAFCNNQVLARLLYEFLKSSVYLNLIVVQFPTSHQNVVRAKYSGVDELFGLKFLWNSTIIYLLLPCIIVLFPHRSSLS
ncbi:13941_t:CDS:2 [Acaulospora colombiana]|uniref:13941_t:CDS:1 n=1 Tax=Acaulospora colombiana TaxID=27376 RepID=A0ACA9KI09_9GLOM|nr:13941_t:CDS:2 [Acaulospora colombiana]